MPRNLHLDFVTDHSLMFSRPLGFVTDAHLWLGTCNLGEWMGTTCCAIFNLLPRCVPYFFFDLDSLVILGWHMTPRHGHPFSKPHLPSLLDPTKPAIVFVPYAASNRQLAHQLSFG